MAKSEGSRLLRERGDGVHARVAYVELFFDLVFVFAITQLSHGLIHHLTLGGALQTLLLLLAVWWVWIFTSWVTNWLDPEETPVRLMLFAMMLAGLVLSASIPKAFEERGLLFAGAYVAMQVGRSLFVLWALRKSNPGNFRNFQRITAWLAMSGALWIAGGLADGNARFAIWSLAMLLELISPSVGFWTPGLGRSTTSDWDVSGAHMAERCGLFVILSLGESILITGSTFAGLTWTVPTTAAFTFGLFGSIAMWWIYFNIGAERATHLIEHSSDPGRIARLAYTYMHVVIVAGIVVAAVADEIVIKHPSGQAGTATALVIIGGPLLFLIGCLLFKWATAGFPPLSHLVGISLLAGSMLFAGTLSPLAVAGLTTTLLIMVAAWEAISLRGAGTPKHGEAAG